MKSLSTLYKLKQEADYKVGEAENNYFWICDEIKVLLNKRRRKRMSQHKPSTTKKSGNGSKRK